MFIYLFIEIVFGCCGLGVLSGTGKFFLQLGIALFVLSHIYIVIINVYGYPINPAMSAMMYILPAVDIGAVVSGALKVTAGVFIPQLAQTASYAVYLTLFFGAASSIASVTASLFSLLPLPGVIPTALTATITSVISGSILYYLATRISGLPAE